MLGPLHFSCSLAYCSRMAFHPRYCFPLRWSCGGNGEMGGRGERRRGCHEKLLCVAENGSGGSASGFIRLG